MPNNPNPVITNEPDKMTIYEAPPVQEQQTNVEVPVPEMPQVSPPQQQAQDDNTQNQTPLAKSKKAAVTNIVDDTKQKTRLHHLEHPIDKLTSLADLEEEEFIEKVETIHESK